MGKSHHSGKCLDNTGRAQVNRHYHQWSCSRNNRNQWFYIRNVARRGRKVKARRNKRRARRGARRGGIPSGWVMIKGRGNLCIRFAGGKKPRGRKGRKGRGGKKPRGAKGRKGKPARKGGKPGRKGGKGKPGRKGGK